MNIKEIDGGRLINPRAKPGNCGSTSLRGDQVQKVHRQSWFHKALV